MAIGTPVAGTLAENATATTSLAVPYPATIAAGDLLLMWVALSIATVPNLPAGWTSIVSGSSGTGSQSPSNRWYYKVATGSETGTQAVTSSSATSRGQMYRISGVDQTTPIAVVGTHVAAAIGAATTHPGVTTTMAGCQVWTSAIKNATGGTFPTVTSPFTMTEAIDDGTPYPTTQVSYLTWSGSGATGTFTFGSDTSVRAGYDVFALRPAADGTPATFTTTVGTATGDGGSTTLTGAGALATSTGTADGTGGATVMTGAATLTTVAASAAAAGSSSALTGAARFATTEATAAAAGGSSSFSAGAGATFATAAGAATATGSDSTLTGAGTFATLAAAAAADGGDTTLTGAAAFTALLGEALADGGQGVMLVVLPTPTPPERVTVIPRRAPRVTVVDRPPRRTTIPARPPRRTEVSP